ncbi:INCENP isoform 1 [Pan troglodytes]|uniref:Inner centromere protein n=2 Tax=Pan troglodytes TaxID=9598 RepID=K7CHZ7_PANTR|nr:inner centromere protein isoform X7 [Pan troglodytes]PNI45303.1 INCENP isoform 1 [Pan troglodytes]
MGTTAPGPIHLLELCDQKLMEFLCNMDNKDLVWLEEIQEEAERMFTREFSKEPELMPKTPSQKNRRKKRRISYVQDENRDPIRRRLSRRKSRSSQLSSRRLRSKDSVEKLATMVGENGSVLRRVTRAAAAAAAATMALAAPSSPTPESPTMLTKKPEDNHTQCQLVPVVEIGISERQNAEQHVTQLMSTEPLPRTLSPTPASATAPTSQGIPTSDEESTPKKSKARILESITVSSLMATPQDPKGQGVGTGRSVSKLRIAQVSPGPRDSPAFPDSPWRERVLAPILPDNFSTPTGSHMDSQSVRHSPIAPSSPSPQVLAQKYSLVAKQESVVRRASRRLAKKTAEEPAASGRIICHSYLERLLNVEVPQKVGSEQKEPPEEAEPVAAAEPEVPENNGNNSWPHNDTEIANSTPNPKPAASSPETPSAGQQEAKTDQADGPREPPQSARRKRSYKQAVSELDEEQHLEDEELQPPRSKTPSSPCPASKVVRPLRTFLHTVQRNQMLMTPTSAPRSVMKSFIKRNTPLRMDPKCSFVEKERQRLENLRRKEEAEQLRRQKVEEDKRRRLEEVKLKREERLRKVLQARERVEQMKEEKKKQIEQKFAQIDEKTEKAKEERLAEEKAKKKAAAKKMEEVEARRKQEEEARRLRWLQQEEEERRHQELLQKKKEEEQERLRKAAEAKRLAEQREQEQREQERREQERREQERREQERQLAEQERRREQERLQAERELQEREKALRLQKEQLQRELEEKKKKEEQQRLAERQLQEEQEKKAKEAAGASKALNVTVDVQSPACTSYQMTPQGHRAPPKINPDNYGMDLNSDDSTDDEAHPRKPIPTWARGTPLSQAIIHQYYHPPNLLELFGTILPLDLEDIFKKSKPRYHKRTSSAVWNSPPLQGARVPSSLAYSLKKH